MLRSIDVHRFPEPNAEMAPLPKVVRHRVFLVLKSIDLHRLPPPNAEMGPLLQLVLQKVLLVLKTSTSIGYPT